MKKLLLFLCFAATVKASSAQINLFNKKKKTSSVTNSDSAAVKVEKPHAEVLETAKVKKDWSKVNLSNRVADHFMIQYGADAWSNRPDSIRTKGFSRHFNFYVMMDKPFKNNPRFSVAYGAGIGSSNMFFDNIYVNLKATGARLPFTDQSSTNHFKKFKLTTIYLEIPVELRFYDDPENTGKSFKAALGVKVGTLLKSYTKGKDLVTSSGGSIYGTSYIQKESNKRYINSTKLAVTGRVGIGAFSLHADYNILGVVKDGTGPAMNAYSIGLNISGL